MSNRKSKTLSYSNPSARFFRLSTTPASSGTPRLLVRSAPAGEESFMGYVVRLTEENYYDTSSWILRLAGIEYKQNNTCPVLYKPAAAQLIKLASLTGNSLSDLAALTYPPAGVVGREDVVLFNNSPVYKYLLSPERPRVCPGCLRESGYCRRIWDLNLVTACPLHRRLLLDVCPRCESHISNKRKRVSFCACGYDYRLARTRPAEDHELALTRQIHLLCGLETGEDAGRQGNSPVHKLNLSDLATLMVFIAGQYTGVFSITGRKNIKFGGQIELHHAFTKAYNNFGDWPHRFYQFLDWRQLQDEQGKGNNGRHHSGLGNCFGSFYEGLYSRLSSPSFGFMRDAFRDYVAAFWQGGYVTKARWHEPPPGKSGTSYLTRTETRRQLGVDAGYVDYLVESGVLKAVVRQTGKKRMFLVDAESLAEVQRVHESSIGINEAAERLDVGVLIARGLVSNGCLKALCAPAASGFKKWRFTEGNVDELLAAVRSKIIPYVRKSNRDRINFRSACRHLSLVRVKVVTFVQIILDGKIYPCGEVKSGVGLSRFEFPVSTFRELLESYRVNKEKAAGSR